MKTVGIIGGIGPESTIEYYRLIISSFLAREKSGNYPQILINSINMKKMLDLIGEKKLPEVTEYLVGEIEKVAKAGADFGVLASNTPHIVFDEVQKVSPIPLLSIVEATLEEVKQQGLKKVGLFGTKFTMQSGFYQEMFKEHDLFVVTPDEQAQDYIHDKYMGELVQGVIRDDTKKKLLNIAIDLEKKEGIEGLILGGTELPLIIKETDDIGLPLFDTTRIHVESILKELL